MSRNHARLHQGRWAKGTESGIQARRPPAAHDAARLANWNAITGTPMAKNPGQDPYDDERPGDVLQVLSYPGNAIRKCLDAHGAARLDTGHASNLTACRKYPPVAKITYYLQINPVLVHYVLIHSGCTMAETEQTNVEIDGPPTGQRGKGRRRF